MLTLRLPYIDYRIFSIPIQEASQRRGAGPGDTGGKLEGSPSKEQRLGGCWPKLKRMFCGDWMEVRLDLSPSYWVETPSPTQDPDLLSPTKPIRLTIPIQALTQA